MPARSGIGTTVAFGTSTTYTPEVKSIQGLGLEREVFDATHMGSPVSATYPGLIMREYSPGDLGKPNQLTLGIHFDPDECDVIPIDQEAEQITITWKKVKVGGTLQTTAANMVFDGFVVSWSAGDMNFEGLMEGTVVIQPAGDIVITIGTVV